MLSELKEIKKLQKRPDGIFGSFMTRPVSHAVAFAAFKLHLSPNKVSFLSFIFCAATVPLLYFHHSNYYYLLLCIALWWIGAIFDAADGDLARWSGQGSSFGGWFDSYLDRIKEFIIFGILGYLSYKIYASELYLLLGFLSIFSNVMSGWISDTKKAFISNRSPEIMLGKKYNLGMVDTRDFVVILTLIIPDFRIALLLYGTIFFLLLFVQTIVFFSRYNKA